MFLVLKCKYKQIFKFKMKAYHGRIIERFAEMQIIVLLQNSKEKDWKKVCCKFHNERQLHFASARRNKKASLCKQLFKIINTTNKCQQI